MKKNPKIIILGAGPCGLGAAWRLRELGYDDFHLFERNSYAGGLASSFQDEKGFTWDIGGHVEFSHYRYYDKVFHSLLQSEKVEREREAWVYLKERFVPYPFQYNIRHLPRKELWECLEGLRELQHISAQNPKNFKEWIGATFGKGIAELFLFPHNLKVWAYPLERMSYDWIGERVAVTDFNRVLENVALGKDEISWGPNNTFTYPLRGGTGEVWRRLYHIVQSNISLNRQARSINAKQHYVTFQDGTREPYDILVTTIPLDKFVSISNGAAASADSLVHSAVHIVGVGLTGKSPKFLQTKCWIYFPEQEYPFSRVTVLSNYSPLNVPEPGNSWSLMAEISESSFNKVRQDTMKKEIIAGLKKAGLISRQKDIISFWYYYEPYGYPVPSLNRDRILNRILPQLEKKDVYSRGRFGAWKYEVSNQDHAFMQGVELVNRLLLGKKEVTVWHPEIINQKKQ